MENPFRSVCRLSTAFAILIVYLASPSRVLSQDRIAQNILEFKTRGHFGERIRPFTAIPYKHPELTKAVRQFSILNIDKPVLNEILEKKPEKVKMVIPTDEPGHELTILMYKADISQAGFTLLTNDEKNTSAGTVVNYRGAIDNDQHSVVAFTFSENQTMGLIANNRGNYVLGKLEGNDDDFIIYNDKNLTKQNDFFCDQRTASNVPGTVQESVNLITDAGTTTTTASSTTTAASASSKCVNWYWETDYDIFVNKGSLANVNAYMQGVFNQVATLYANDGIAVNLKTLFVWTSPDPYTGSTAGDYLNKFTTYRTSWNGDLAHLIGYAGNGGIAYVNGIAMCSYGVGQVSSQMAYSGISSSYSTVPTYSWTVSCITHEQGHQLGSHHTHDCAWNGNNTKIDDCGGYAGYSSGSCLPQPNPVLPVGGGTIMSYCHLTSAGVNFNLGFGPQPRTLITNNVNAAPCLTYCTTTTCATPALPGTITGSASVCPNTSKTYSVAAVSGATSYTWTLPSGWTGASTTNSITVTTGTTDGSVTVKANNNCGSSAVQSLNVTSGIPSTPASITGNTVVCPGSSLTYSVAAVPDASSYEWTIPSGWTGTSTTNSITVITGQSGGTISVKAMNSCATSAASSITTNVSPDQPVNPGAISGDVTTCANSSETYSVAAVAGATSYTWKLPTGWTGTSTSNSITVVTGTYSGTISVTANNSCGTSTASTMPVTYTGVPSVPGSITISGGINKVCPGDTRGYSVPAVAGLSYQWTVPAGATIINGQGTNDIDVEFSTGFTAAGYITVKAVNSCAMSNARTYTMYTNLPSAPGSISVTGGDAKVCPGDVTTYSVNAVNGVTYRWVAPNGAEIISGQGTNSVQISYTSAFTANGTLSVYANNTCGTSGARNLTVYRDIPSQPSAITVTGGTAKVCPGDVRTYTVTNIAGMRYTWTAPDGAVINSGQGTNSVNISYGNDYKIADYLSVTASNNCSTSAARNLLISPNLPLAPGGISGPTAICLGSTTTYSISAVSNALSYEWTVPAGASIVGATNGRTISVLWNSAAGIISVKSVNNCGVSAARNLSVVVNCPAGMVGPADASSNNAEIQPSVYPNPAEGSLTLKYYSDIETDHIMELRDLAGRMIKSEMLHSIHGVNIKQYNWSNLPSGMYYIILRNKFTVSRMRFEMR